MSRGWIFFIVIVVLYTIFILFTRTPDFFSGKFTKGKVTNLFEETYDVQRSSRDAIVRVPAVEYYVNGVKYLFYDDKAKWPPVYEVGEEVTIIYDPKDPANAYIYAWIGYWLNISEFFISFLVVGIPLAVYLAVRKRTERENIRDSSP
jgi:hypothetical protein